MRASAAALRSGFPSPRRYVNPVSGVPTRRHHFSPPVCFAMSGTEIQGAFRAYQKAAGRDGSGACLERVPLPIVGEGA